MSLIFNEFGFLTPQDVIHAGLESFENIFVKEFINSNTRSPIFENYLSYISAFKQEIMPEFRQWVDGSFVTKKLNPKDIDIVTFIPFEVYENRRKEIEAKFIMGGALKHFGVDAYAIRTYPEKHELHFVTLHDTAEWRETFSKTKFNKNQKRYPKGFIELNF
ncbi:MAG: hypothetical protein MUC59_01170 [Saprospiraceae bacterium]|jgi:hypothetical protein|nr:hypothetical protein [Saprospiraceae bacterium]